MSLAHTCGVCVTGTYVWSVCDRHVSLHGCPVPQQHPQWCWAAHAQTHGHTRTQPHRNLDTQPHRHSTQSHHHTGTQSHKHTPTQTCARTHAHRHTPTVDMHAARHVSLLTMLSPHISRHGVEQHTHTHTDTETHTPTKTWTHYRHAAEHAHFRTALHGVVHKTDTHTDTPQHATRTQTQHAHRRTQIHTHHRHAARHVHFLTILSPRAALDAVRQQRQPLSSNQIDTHCPKISTVNIYTHIYIYVHIIYICTYTHRHTHACDVWGCNTNSLPPTNSILNVKYNQMSMCRWYIYMCAYIYAQRHRHRHTHTQTHTHVVRQQVNPSPQTWSTLPAKYYTQ